MVPFDRCARWRLHEAYFGRQGLAPWLEGEVPHQATNNYTFAQAHAALLSDWAGALTHAGRLPAVEPVALLEVGGGLGQFAAHFLTALREDLGEAGRSLLARLTYLFSDVSRTTVAEAVAQPELAPWVRAGRLVPLVFDAREPYRARRLDGSAAPLGAPFAVIANYVCCVLPSKVLRKHAGGWYELHAAADRPRGANGSGTWRRLLGEHEWRRLGLEEIFDRPLHRLVLARALSESTEAELAYPYAFLDLIDTLTGVLRPGGVFLFSDFGDDSYEDRIGLADRSPVVYGESLAQPVCFPLIRSFAESTGLTVLESRGGHGATRSVAVTPGPVPGAVRQSFEASTLRANAGQDLLDFASAAKALARAGDSSGALRFYDRCLRLSPRDPLLYLRAGEECLAGGRCDAAVEYFRRGAAVDEAGEYDFECRIGEACCWMNEPGRAVDHLRVSARRRRKPGTYVLLGEAYTALGDRGRARRAYRRALALEAGQPAALEGLRLLER
ncbi:MAG: hypothetical protein HY900_17620 [Deltaproteobacteria bacterium]|nr:hypothetical protein [Deltaproteobacteria bacterium]